MENIVLAAQMKTPSTIEVTRTYLEMRDAAELLAARCDDPSVRVEQTPDCSASFYRHLYVEVGRNYHWIDRLPWTDEQIAAHLQQADISLWLMTQDGATAGYFELRRCEDGSVGGLAARSRVNRPSCQGVR